MRKKSNPTKRNHSSKRIKEQKKTRRKTHKENKKTASKSLSRSSIKNRRLGQIVIQRTSGRKERFDTDKLAQTVSRSGTPYLMARDIAKTVSDKVAPKPSLNKEKKREIVVDGSKVRKMVIKQLKNRNRSDIASSYSGETSRNTRQGRFDMMNKNEPVLDGSAANRSRLLFDGSSKFAKSTKSASTK